MKLATERLKKILTVQGGRTLRADVRICVRWRYFQSYQMEQYEEAALHSFSLLNWKPPSACIISEQPAASARALKESRNEGICIIISPATLKQMVHSGSDGPSVSSDTPHTHYHQ